MYNGTSNEWCRIFALFGELKQAISAEGSCDLEKEQPLPGRSGNDILRQGLARAKTLW